ncbi:MAG: ABC transporter permease [Dehalococcoidia bacterium]|nr:ABC transporter permease [Dehalococcoidia bacterium]
MGQIILRRIAFTLPVLFGVTVVVFLLVRLLPGDIANYILGAGAPAEQVAALRKELGLDGPWHEQYGIWLQNTATGSFGYSNQYRRPVEEVIWPKLQNTLILGAGGFSIAVFFGVSIGVFTGIRPNTWLDRVATTLSIVGASVPAYWLGLVLMFIFALRLRWLPSSGMYAPVGGGGLIDLGRHMLLPAITIAAVPTAVISRLVRSTMIEEMSQDYIRTARSKGLNERRVVMVHAFRNAMPTTVNIVALQLGYVIGGSIFAEIIFSWPGMGSQLYSSIGARDAAVIQIITLMTAITFVTVNFIADISHSLIDPRVRMV